MNSNNVAFRLSKSSSKQPLLSLLVTLITWNNKFYQGKSVLWKSLYNGVLQSQPISSFKEPSHSTLSQIVPFSPWGSQSYYFPLLQIFLTRTFWSSVRNHILKVSFPSQTNTSASTTQRRWLSKTRSWLGCETGIAAHRFRCNTGI